MEKADYSSIGHDKWYGGEWGETVATIPEYVAKRIDAATVSLMILLDKAGIEYLHSELSGVCHVIQIDSCICDVHGVPGRYGELVSIALDVREPYCMTKVAWAQDDKFKEDHLEMIKDAVKLWALHDAAAKAREKSLALADAINNQFEGRIVFAVEDDGSVSCRITGLGWEQGLRVASFIAELPK